MIILENAHFAYLRREKIETNKEYDHDQGGRIQRKYITEELANKYFAMFWGRTDVYAKRGMKGGYLPQCDHRWNNRICPKQRGENIKCEACEHKRWTELKPEKIIEHLLEYREDGADVLGVYPLFPDETCRFIVFDFDSHKKGTEKTDFANMNTLSIL